MKKRASLALANKFSDMFVCIFYNSYAFEDNQDNRRSTHNNNYNNLRFPNMPHNALHNKLHTYNPVYPPFSKLPLPYIMFNI